jgi:hypothetical protein
MSEQSTMSRQGIMIEVVIPSSKGLVKTKKGLPEIGMKIKINNEEKTITLDQFITESYKYFAKVVELEDEIAKLREETTKYSNKIVAFLDAMKGV